MGKITKGVMTIFVAFLYWLIYIITLPTLSLAYFSGVAFIGFGALLLLAFIVIWIYDDIEDVHPIFGILAVCIAIVVPLVGAFIGSPLVNHEAMHKQIGEIQELSFKEDIVELDTSQIPIVDIDLASKLADKKLGEDLALGSQMQVGKFTNKQSVNGKLVYVAPLEHIDFFRWNSNKEGTSGYVIVSATNPNDVEFVRQLNGKDIKLKYLESAYFGSDLKRHIRNSGYITTGIHSEYSFELDDEYNPYWVVATYENTTVWDNPETTGVIVVDAQSGETNWYSVDEAPSWIDIVQPEEFITSQIENYGELVHGCFNFSGKDKLTMTPHITTVYNDGQCYYYTGLSSAGSDEGTVGFIMVNTRDKSAKMYRMVGATESAAMKSAEGEVADMKYVATTPIPLNVSGIPTYFLTLKDAEGLVKSYAMVNIQDYSIVKTGSTISESKRAYINAVNNGSASLDFTEGEAYGYVLTGIVSRIGSNIENGSTYYYMIIDDDETKLFLASYMISEELPITCVGDTVEISYVDEANGTINVVSFDNIAFAQPLTEKQENLNDYKEENNLINNPENNVVEVNPEKNEKTWESLTDEEKSKLIELLK